MAAMRVMAVTRVMRVMAAAFAPRAQLKCKKSHAVTVVRKPKPVPAAVLVNGVRGATLAAVMAKACARWAQPKIKKSHAVTAAPKRKPAHAAHLANGVHGATPAAVMAKGFALLALGLARAALWISVVIATAPVRMTHAYATFQLDILLVVRAAAELLPEAWVTRHAVSGTKGVIPVVQVQTLYAMKKPTRVATDKCVFLAPAEFDNIVILLCGQWANA